MVIIRAVVTVVVAGALAAGSVLSPSHKLIALTFDDGPRSEVLVGGSTASANLLGVLNRHGVLATFFFMGWRLADANSSDAHAAVEAWKRGHEIENHTYGHGAFKTMVERYGTAWVLEDIDKASDAVFRLTGYWPLYVRPPDWSIWQDVRDAIEAEGYIVVTKSVNDIDEPVLLADVDTEDYRIYQPGPLRAEDIATLHGMVLEKISRRERRSVFGHVLVFHELPLSIAAVDSLVPMLRERGYEFVTLAQYRAALKNDRLRTPSRYLADMLRSSLWQ